MSFPIILRHCFSISSSLLNPLSFPKFPSIRSKNNKTPYRELDLYTGTNSPLKMEFAGRLVWDGLQPLHAEGSRWLDYT